MNSSIPEKPPEKTCRLCQNWERDQVGDGTGMGMCKLNINPAQLKWPNITACSSYKGEGESHEL